MLKLQQFYVSVSCGVERCFIYTDDKEALKWAAGQEADRMSAGEIAASSKDRSLWLASRNAIRQQQVQQYQKDMERYHRSKQQKEQTYERDIPILPSRGGEELHLDL